MFPVVVSAADLASAVRPRHVTMRPFFDPARERSVSVPWRIRPAKPSRKQRPRIHRTKGDSCITYQDRKYLAFMRINGEWFECDDGVVESVRVSTRIRLPHDDGGTAIFRGDYAAFTRLEALDMSVIGRDIMEMFAVLVDRLGDVVTLIRQPHHYTIET